MRCAPPIFYKYFYFAIFHNFYIPSIFSVNYSIILNRTMCRSTFDEHAHQPFLKMHYYSTSFSFSLRTYRRTIFAGSDNAKGPHVPIAESVQFRKKKSGKYAFGWPKKSEIIVAAVLAFEFFGRPYTTTKIVQKYDET